MDHAGCAGLLQRTQQAEPRDVEERQDGEPDIVGPERPGGRELGVLGEKVGVAQDGSAQGASHGRSVDDHEGVASLHIRAGQQRDVALECGEGGEAGGWIIEAVPALHAGSRPSQLRQHGTVFGLGDDDPGRDVGQHMRDLLGPEPPVHGNQDGAEPGGGADEVDEFGPVLAQDGDTVAAIETRRGEPGRQGLRARQNIAVGDPVPFEDERGAGREEAAVALEPVEQRKIPNAHPRLPARVVPNPGAIVDARDAGPSRSGEPRHPASQPRPAWIQPVPPQRARNAAQASSRPPTRPPGTAASSACV